MKQPNWVKISETLKENFIDRDFVNEIAFSGINFDKCLELFYYIINKKLPNHSETNVILEALQAYADGNQNKVVLEKLISKYEPFTKKILELVGQPYIPTNNNSAPALGWCYKNLFNKLPLPIQNQKINDFYSKTLDGKIDIPNFDSSIFSTGFLTDGTSFGKCLHKTYHLRNSNIHNDPNILNRDIPEFITDSINSYLYFIVKYFNDLENVISDNELGNSLSIEFFDLASLSGGAYNTEIENEVLRDDIVKIIHSKLKKVDILFLEGAKGVGKTTVLNQFVTKNRNNCFAYFIDGKDKNTYTSLAILQAFCNQIHFYQKGVELHSEIDSINWLDEGYLKKYFAGCPKLKAPISGSLYFIIDGFDEIDENSRLELKEEIIDLIPLNRDYVKVIVTGEYVSNIFSDKNKYESWEVPTLSFESAKNIFGNSVSLEQFIEINKLCENNSGKLVFIRELIKEIGIDVENLINSISNNIESLYTYLWDTYTQKNNTLQGLLLAIVAYEEKKYPIELIANFLSKPNSPITINDVKIEIEKIPFIRRNFRGTYEYIFGDLANFAKKKLVNYKHTIDRIIIDYLQTNFNSIESLINLPELFKDTGKIDDLIKLLGEDRWKQLLQSSQSISDVSKVSTVTLEAIQDKNENKFIPVILKYSILKSALKDLSQTSIWHYEIAANLSLEEDLNAINLVSLAFLKEDKLKLLASIAKTYTQKKKTIPNSIINQIKELFKEIDFKNSGNSALELASLLMYSSPKLAFQLIESLSGSISDNDNAFDWALAQISLNAYTKLKDSEDISKEDVNAKIYSKIRDPKIKEFTDAVLHLSENEKFEDILIKIIELESTSQKLFLIRNWILKNKENEHVAEMITIGINLVVNKSDKYIPKANDFKIFSAPLPYIKEKEKAFELITLIQDHLSSIESTSNTIDLLNIKLLISQALCNFDFIQGEEKLSEIYSEICQIYDLALKSSCLSIYAGFAVKIKNAFPDKDMEIYSDSAKDDIENSIDKILSQTAEHFEIVQSIIVNIVKIYPYTAIEISKKLNKSIDRDNAFLESLAIYLRQDIKKISTDIVDQLLENIFDPDIKKIAILEIFHKLDSLDDNKYVPVEFERFFQKIEDVLDNELKCFLYIILISILEKGEKNIDGISNKLKNNWSELETSASKIELGFEIAFKLSFLKTKVLGKDFLKLARDEKCKPELLMDSPKTAKIFFQSVELVIALFSGLILKNNYDDSDIETLESIIGNLPSETQKIQLWASFVMKISQKTDKELPSKIINTFIIPKLGKIKNKSERIDIIIDIIPVLYLVDLDLSILEELPTQKLKDIALLKVCKFLQSNCNPNDLCDDNEKGFIIDYETLKKILNLVKKISNDYIIAWQIDELRKSIISLQTTISATQIVEVKKEIELIANENLPDQNNIKHDGYKLLVKAYAISIQKHPKREEWDNILKEVDRIPNLSDRIFLWISLTSLISDRPEYGTLKYDLIIKASKFSYELPSFLDTVGKVSMIFMNLTSKKINGINLKTLINDFVSSMKQKDLNPKLKNKYRNILDVAYSTDPSIAKVFVNQFDNDSARRNTGAFLNNHLNYLEFQTKLEDKIDNSKTEQELIEQNPKYFERIIEKRLGRLNALKSVNDNLYPKDLIYLLNIASQRTLKESQNSYLYFIERLIIVYENTNESKKIIKKSFYEIIEIVNLIKLLSIRNAEKIKSLFDIISEEIIDENTSLARIRDDIGEITYGQITKLLSKDFSEAEISNMLKIDLDNIFEISSDLKNNN